MLEPLKLPTAAGLSFGDGDVRHITADDSNSPQSQARATRNLAERDNILAEAINRLIGEVNNKEQVIDIQVPQLQLSPSQSFVVSSYRIPNGFEARVLNAIIQSVPTSLARLDIIWSSTYGDTSGTSVVSTLTEVTGQTVFYGSGCFVIKITNTGSSSIEVIGDVQITMRPVAQLQGSLLTPSIIVGTSGFSGQNGSNGVSGFSGARGLSGYSGYSGEPARDGVASYTTTTASFVMPSVGSPVMISVVDTSFMAVGEPLFIYGADSFVVTTIHSGISVTVTRLGYTATSGTITSGKLVTPTGFSGFSGTPSSSSISFSQSTVVAAFTYSGGTSSTDGLYQGVSSSGGNFSLNQVTITSGSSTIKIIQGQILCTLRAGNFIITLPTGYTISNTFLDVTLDGNDISNEQPLKQSTASNIWKLVIGAGHVGDTHFAISYFGMIVTP